MDSLSSCYFCGIALDEPLETYLLGTGDTEASVTLCPTCHRKLETVLDTVAVGDDALSKGDRSNLGSAADVPTTGQSTGPETPADSDAEPTQTGVDASDILVDPEPDEAPDADDETGTEAATADGTDGRDTGDEKVKAAIEDQEEEAIETGEAEGAIADRRGEATAGHGEDETERLERNDETASEDAEDTIDRGETQDETAIEGREAETESEDGDAETESGDSETASEGGESGTDDAGESQTDRTVRTSISALEYNKVMRLLQNREFPVDREEIESIASNAYDLSRSDCTKVIDLAIDRGLLDEDGGQLERPEQ